MFHPVEIHDAFDAAQLDAAAAVDPHGGVSMHLARRREGKGVPA
jgi:hypothetical protein